jgi:hypothetical protein
MLITMLDMLLDREILLQFLAQLIVFAWVYRVTVEFRDAPWSERVVVSIFR